MPITGTTRLYAILADPVAQVRTPEVFNAWFAARGTDAVLVPVHLAAGRLEVALPALRAMKNLGGLVVTVPHKTDAARLCDTLTEAARLTGSVNAIRRDPDGSLHGATFDGEGFVAGLRAQGHDPAGRRVLMVGAGGAGAAVALALARAGVARLVIANRTAARAETLAAAIASACPEVAISAGAAEPGDAEIIVNTTSLGMAPGDPLPLSLEGAAPGALVAEVIMKPETTPLLAEAALRQHPVHHGRHMLDRQVDLIAAFIGAG